VYIVGPLPVNSPRGDDQQSFAGELPKRSESTTDSRTRHDDDSRLRLYGVVKRILVCGVATASIAVGASAFGAPATASAVHGRHECRRRPADRAYYLKADANRRTSCALAIAAEYAYRSSPASKIRFHFRRQWYALGCEYGRGVAVCSRKRIWVRFKGPAPGTNTGTY
jgi:hypothetical protein